MALYEKMGIDKSMRASHDANKRAAMNAGLISLACQTFTLALCAITPDDQLTLARGISIYAAVALMINIVGIVEIFHEQAFFAKCFSYFILIDTFISATLRLLLEEIAFEGIYASNVCSIMYDSSTTSAPSMILSAIREAFNSPSSCNIALATVHFAIVVTVLMTSATQLSQTLIVRSYAHSLHDEEERDVSARAPLLTTAT